MKVWIGGSKQQKGMAYLWILFAVTLLGLGLGKALDIYSHESQRQKEEELVYIGEQYRQAIKAFYNSSPGTVKQYPRSLSDLLLDKRMLSTRRYIRKLYKDPITNSDDWGLVHDREGGLIGVYSLSEKEPIRRSISSSIPASKTATGKYEDWKFIFTSTPF